MNNCYNTISQCKLLMTFKQHQIENSRGVRPGEQVGLLTGSLVPIKFFTK